MYEDIKKNKIKTGFILFGFILVITLIVYTISMAFDLGIFSLVIALVFSTLCAFSSYYYSDKIILSINHARPATKEENLKLVNILDSLIVSSGLESTPKLYIVEDLQPNAFATGRNPKNAIICVTTGLLEKLNYYELEGVIAHELGHIKNYDILLSAVITVMVGLVVMVCDFCTRTLYWNRRSSNKENNSGAFFMLLGLIFLILGPLLAKLMQLAVSRRREFLADATAIGFTRNPSGLISALKKLDQDLHELNHVNTATAHMYITNPFKKEHQNSNWLSTHPSIEARIEALEKLK